LLSIHVIGDSLAIPNPAGKIYGIEPASADHVRVFDLTSTPDGLEKTGARDRIIPECLPFSEFMPQPAESGLFRSPENPGLQAVPP
jgi:hypothetical protein